MTQVRAQRWALSLSVAAAIALVWWSAWPNWQEGTSRQIRAAELDSKVSGLGTAEAELTTATERLAVARRTRDEKCRQIPAIADVAGLMQSLSLPVDGQRVFDQTFAVVDRPQKGSAQFELLPLRMDLDADFNSIWTVLDRVENLPRLVRVSGLDINLGEDTDPDRARCALEASLSLDLVYAPINEKETGR